MHVHGELIQLTAKLADEALKEITQEHIAFLVLIVSQIGEKLKQLAPQSEK